MILTEFGDLIAERMRAEHRTLAVRWFERLIDLLPVDAREVFPTESLLDHIPALILEISSYLRHPDAQAIAANTGILQKARELGALRHDQRASLHQVLREYQVLNGVLVTFVLEEMGRIKTPPPPADGVAFVARIHQAVDVLSQSTVETFVTLYMQTISEQNERLDQFTRMASHEFRQPLAALQVAVKLLRRFDQDREGTERTLAAIERNIQNLAELTQKLEVVARMQSAADNPVVQEIPAATVAQEAARQIREMADSRGVDVRIADDLPTLTVDVGRLELVFVNLLSNAVKYSDPSKAERYVEVTGATDGNEWCEIQVRDNGIGIPENAVSTIFQRFSRAHANRADAPYVDGVGLGLSIVEDCVRTIGGQVAVRSVEGEGTVFSLALPRAPQPPGTES